MKTELLYFDGCPSYTQALENLKQALQLERLPDEVEMIEVTDPADADAKRFIGSPSIRIDGIDIDGPVAATRGYAYRCRVYTDEGRAVGWPSIDRIRQALQRVQDI